MISNQRGAALIVVLSMLTASLMLGLTSMQSSMIDERLAGNFKAAAQAQMNAEEGGSEFFDWLKAQGGWPGNNDDQNGWQDGDADDISLSGYSIQDVVWGGDEVLLTVRGVGPGGAESFLEATFSVNSLSNARADAAFTCFGENCSYEAGAANGNSAQHVGINGNDHRSAGQCSSIQGSNDPELNSGGEDRAGIIMPSGTISAQGGDEVDGDDTDAIIGDPAYIDEDDDYLVTSYHVSGGLDSGDGEEGGLRQVYAEYYKAIVEEIERRGAAAGEVSGDAVLAYAGVGETVEIDGEAGGIIVLEGGSLSMSGNDCFTGLIIAMPGENDQGEVVNPSFVSGNGTPAIIGAIWGEEFSVSGTGNSSIYYSSQGLVFDDLFQSRGSYVVLERWDNVASM
ncbi:pilus assembly PilX family protein [Onishia taeanensis]